MNTWVLVIVLFTGYGGGPSVIDGFSSESSCEKAMGKLEIKYKKMGTSISMTCIEKE